MRDSLADRCSSLDSAWVAAVHSLRSLVKQLDMDQSTDGAAMRDVTNDNSCAHYPSVNEIVTNGPSRATILFEARLSYWVLSPSD